MSSHSQASECMVEELSRMNWYLTAFILPLTKSSGISPFLLLAFRLDNGSTILPLGSIQEMFNSKAQSTVHNVYT